MLNKQIPLWKLSKAFGICKWCEENSI